MSSIEEWVSLMTTTFKRINDIRAQIYTLISDTTPLPEAIRPSSIASQIVTFNSFTPQPQGEATFNDWYEKDYIPALSKIPGWVRTRRFKLDDVALSGLSVAGEEKEKGAGIPIFLELSGMLTSSLGRHVLIQPLIC